MKLLTTRLILVFLFLSPQFLPAQSASALPSKKKEVHLGLIWKQIRTKKLFNSQQNINILEINQNYNFKLAYSSKSLIPTSVFAKNNKAVAAINGGFFDLKTGNSVTYFKVEGQEINKTIQRFSDAQNEILESALVIDDEGKLLIRSTENLDKWKSQKRYASILVTGPLLLFQGKEMPLVDRSFTNKRHPRTCACTTSENKTLLITVDGRHKKAEGMSLQELTDLTQMLGCRNAINLDGGGSTTMYIKEATKSGVVNRPSDNGKFDHEGERACANVLLVVGNE